jgi:quercetin dioxygenase-like cupin family protein
VTDQPLILLDAGATRPGRQLPPGFAVKALTEATGGQVALLEVTVARPIPRHVHHTADEGIYVLDGALGIDYVDGSHIATEGMFVLLPPGVPHALRPASTHRRGCCRSPRPAAGSTTQPTCSRPGPPC